jgi:hypothetical protein
MKEKQPMQYKNDENAVDINLMARVYGEYMEMPGLQLTLAQASRLWNMQLATSAHVLERLVDASFLRRAGDRYVRADCWRISA